MTSVLALVASNAIIATILALFTAMVIRLWRSPQLAHALWLLVLLKLITPPLVAVSPPSEWLPASLPTIEPSPSATAGVAKTISNPKYEVLYLPEPDVDHAAPTAAPPIAPPESPAAMARVNDVEAATSRSKVIDTPAPVSPAIEFKASHWPTAVAVIWLVGAIIYLTILVRRCIGFRRVLSASTAAGAEITEPAVRLASKLGLRRSPPVRVVDAPIPPLVWSLGLRPIIVLPMTLLAELTPTQRDALVAHELAHVRRRDHLVRWLEVIALVAFWWNPLAWLARRQLREAEEECCDAWVVWALPGERRSYGEAMLATIEFLTDGPKLPALAGSTFGGYFFKRRIEMIMKQNISRRISWTALAMIVLVAVAVLPLVAQTGGSEDNSAQPAAADAAEPGVAADAHAVEEPAVAAKSAAAHEEHSSNSQPASERQERSRPPQTKATDVETEAILVVIKPIAGQQQLEPENVKLEFWPKHLVPKGAVKKIEEVVGRRVKLALVPGEPILQNRLVTLTDGDDVVADSQASAEELLDRISRLEQLLQGLTEQRGAADTRMRSGASRVSDSSISSDKQEQDLQQQLLMLDIAAAKAEIEPARIKWQKSVEANNKHRGAVSPLEIELQRAELEQKQVQLRRAETLLALYKRQVERKREQAARQRASVDTPWNRQLIDATQRAQRAEEFDRVKKLNMQIANEVSRLENLLKESPDSPEAWQALEEFLKIYRMPATRSATDEQPRGGESRP